MPRKDWRDDENKVTVITHGVWYRSPLWISHDHLLGRSEAFTQEGIAWCGRPLQLALDGWGDPKLEGLWVTNRTAAKCSRCKRDDTEWLRTHPAPENHRPF